MWLVRRWRTLARTIPAQWAGIVFASVRVSVHTKSRKLIIRNRYSLVGICPMMNARSFWHFGCDLETFSYLKNVFCAYVFGVWLLHRHFSVRTSCFSCFQRLVRFHNIFAFRLSFYDCAVIEVAVFTNERLIMSSGAKGLQFLASQIRTCEEPVFCCTASYKAMHTASILDCGIYQ